MDLNEIGKSFSRKYFSTMKKLEDVFEKYIIEKNIDKETSKFYKRHGIEPREQEIVQIKKDIVMKQGLTLFILLFAVIYLCISVFIGG